MGFNTIRKTIINLFWLISIFPLYHGNSLPILQDQKILIEGLNNIPTYTITNSQSSPYLVPWTFGKNAAIVFLDKEDADGLLNEICQANGSYHPLDIRLCCMPLSKALSILNESYKSENGTLWKLYPSSKQSKHSKSLMEKSQSKKPRVNIPLFYADELHIRKGGGSVIPMFFDKEDLIFSWTKRNSSLNHHKEVPTIRCLDLLELLDKLDKNRSSAQYFQLVPSSCNREFVKHSRVKGTSLSRLTF